MHKRVLIILAALAFPLIAAAIVVAIALPESLPFRGKNTMPMSQAPAATSSKVPVTLEEAKLLAAQRLAYLQGLSQKEWEVERKNVAHKFPPARIDDAVARTKRRIDDLNKLSPSDWEEERKRLLKREAVK